MQRSLDHIVSIILHASELLEEKLKQDSDLKNLTTRQLSCVESIKDLKNPTLSELTGKMNIAKSSVSVMIDRLEKNNYIYRVTSDSDRRVAHVHLTEKGEIAANLHDRLHRRISELLTKEMTTSEKEILVVLLDKSIISIDKRIENTGIK